MASSKSFFSTVILTCHFIISISAFLVSSYDFQFQIGGDSGWAVPPNNHTLTHNDWAGKNRFLTGDTLCEYIIHGIKSITISMGGEFTASTRVMATNPGQSKIVLTKTAFQL